MDLGLKGKRAIILGGSRGIGFYTAGVLCDEGASVAFCARGAAGVQEAITALSGRGDGVVFGGEADLESGEATRAFCLEALAALGGCDILIHNASAFGQPEGEAGWLRSFQIDVMAGVRAVETCEAALTESEAASITFIGSMASKYYFGRSSPYGPAKGAMRVYANELAQRLGPQRIRANVVSPGAVWFPGGGWDRTKTQSPKFYAAVERAIPLGRLGTADELARAIVFVASPAGSWINAAHIVVDGGQVAAVD